MENRKCSLSFRNLDNSVLRICNCKVKESTKYCPNCGRPILALTTRDYVEWAIKQLGLSYSLGEQTTKDRNCFENIVFGHLSAHCAAMKMSKIVPDIRLVLTSTGPLVADNWKIVFENGTHKKYKVFLTYSLLDQQD